MPEPRSAIERVETALAAIERDNAHSAIFISVDAEGARRAAAQSDARLTAGQTIGPLDGRCVGIKDNLAVAGLPWTAGIGAYQARPAGQDSGVVARLRAAGAIIIGTLNLHEGALGATTDNPHFGVCQNPLRDGFTPGGSSGGSGAAVAAGHVDMAVGTDTMGSVRIPAAYCGTAGIKPTDGLVGRQGLSFLSPSLDTIGPLTRTVGELRAWLTAMAGRDDDPRALGAPARWPDDGARLADLAGIRIGVPTQIDEVDCASDVLADLSTARTALRSLGAKVIDIDLDGWRPGPTRRGGLMLAEAEGAVVMADLLDAGVRGVSDQFRALLAFGANLPSARMVEALDRMANARAACHRALRAVDLIMMPTAPQPAFAHGDAVPANQADFTTLANCAGCPALSVPVPAASGQLPTGVQLVAAPWRDLRLLAIGEALETALSQ